MSQVWVAQQLRQIDYFSHLSQEYLNLIATQVASKRFNAGEFILKENEPTTGLYMIIEGQARLSQIGADGRDYAIADLVPGQFIDLEAILRPANEAYTLQALNIVTVLFLSREKFLTLLASWNDLKIALGLDKSILQQQSPIQFKGQREDEVVIKYFHQHWWSFVNRVWIPIAILIICAVVSIMINRMPVFLALMSFGILLSGIWVVYSYLEWRNDVFIITDQRVIRVIRKILGLSDQISEVAIESIHEVSYELPGADPFSRIFNYGNVILRTAGSAGNMILAYVMHPHQIQKTILNAQDNAKKKKTTRHTAQMLADIDKWTDVEQTTTTPVNTPSSKNTQRLKGLPLLRLAMPTADGGTLYRKHYVAWIKELIWGAVIFIVGLIGMVLGLSNTLGALSPIVIVISILALIAGGLWAFFAHWDWSNDYFKITDARITIVHKRPLWLQDENEQILMRQVDNVISEASGFFAQMLNYGTVRVALMGADNYKILDHVPNPIDIQQEISGRIARAKKMDAEAQASQQREIIGEYISLYHQNYGQPAPQGPPASSALQAPQAPYPTAPQAPTPYTPAPQNLGQAPQVYNPSPQQPYNPLQTGTPSGTPPPHLPTRPPSSFDAARPPRFGGNQVPKPYLSPGQPYQAPENPLSSTPPNYKKPPPRPRFPTDDKK